MGLLRRLFFSKSDLPALRKAVSSQRYADALLIAEELLEGELDKQERTEIETLAAQAGNTWRGSIWMKDCICLKSSNGKAPRNILPSQSSNVFLPH